jgi:hypothetical protein
MYYSNGYIFILYVNMINCSFLLFRSLASSFNSQYLLVILKSSRSSVYLIHTFLLLLSSNGIVKQANCSDDMSNPVDFSQQDIT